MRNQLTMTEVCLRNACLLDPQAASSEACAVQPTQDNDYRVQNRVQESNVVVVVNVGVLLPTAQGFRSYSYPGDDSAPDRAEESNIVDSR